MRRTAASKCHCAHQVFLRFCFFFLHAVMEEKKLVENAVTVFLFYFSFFLSIFLRSRFKPEVPIQKSAVLELRSVVRKSATHLRLSWFTQWNTNSTTRLLFLFFHGAKCTRQGHSFFLYSRSEVQTAAARFLLFRFCFVFVLSRSKALMTVRYGNKNRGVTNVRGSRSGPQRMDFAIEEDWQKIMSACVRQRKTDRSYDIVRYTYRVPKGVCYQILSGTEVW